MMPLTRQQLDDAGYDNPLCTHDHSVLFLHASCHPGARLDVMYIKARGTMHIVCTECTNTVADVLVARMLDQ